MDIAIWLRSLGLGKYEAAFRENEIDETVLPSLTHETLKELGLRFRERFLPRILHAAMGEARGKHLRGHRVEAPGRGLPLIGPGRAAALPHP
jgi:hypothetical protein